MSRTHKPETGWFPVEANGQTFACFGQGTGPLVLLVHGFPDTPHSWDRMRRALVKAGYRAVSPFTRGYAPTTIPSSDAYDIDTLGRDVVGLIEALGSEKATVIGHDWGAGAAYAAAALAPERVDKLVTVGIPHQAGVKPDLALAWAVRHFLTLKLPGAVRRFKADDFAQMDHLVRRWGPTWQFTAADLEPAKNALSAPGSANAALGYYRCLRLRPPASARLPIHAPTLCVYGADDPALDEPIYERARKAFTSTYEVVRIAGGHWPHLEDPVAFEAHVLEFLESSPA